MDEDTKKKIEDRAERFTSHALVEVRPYKWFGFGAQSAVLLDMSVGGFKLEFTGEFSAKPGERYWLNIPLTPLGIFAPERLFCRAECRWFDEKRFRIGGTFSDLTDQNRVIIEQIMEALKEKGNSF